MKCNECNIDTYIMVEDPRVDIVQHHPDSQTMRIETYFCSMACMILWAHKKWKEKHAIDD